MICQKCLKNEATVFIDAVVNGNRWKCHVCARCASREVIMDSAAAQSASASQGRSAEMPAKQKASSAVRAFVGRGVCPVCGTARKEIKKTSRFGCAKCYELFGEGILSSAAGPKTSCSVPHEDGGKTDPASAVKKLREKLARAVRREDYEEAASIRDKIKQYAQ